MSDPHTPPRTYADIAGMDRIELMAGYIGYDAGDPEPGANHSRAYWWGWHNRRNDALGIVSPEQAHVVALIAPGGRVMTEAEIQAAAEREKANV